MTVTLSPKQFLRKNVIEGIANKQLEQQLDFKDVFDVVFTDAVSVTYSEDTTTAGDDITSETMGAPLDMGELSELTSIEVSKITQKAGMLKPFGYQIKVSERDIRRSEVIDELTRAVDRSAFGMAKKINDDIVTKLSAVTNDITEVAGDAAWNADTADPIKDIVSFQEAMDVEGFPYQMTDLFLHKTNFYELKKFMLGIDRSWALDPTGGQKDVPNLMGVNIHNTHSTQLSESNIIGLDSRPGYRGMTLYAYRPAEMAGRAESPMINVYQYKEEKYPHNIVTEFVSEILPALKIPNAVYYMAAAV